MRKGNLLLVKTAAQLSVGPSVKWITVPLMGKGPIVGASLEINLPDAVPVANPLGSPETPWRNSMYASLLAKSGRTAGVSLEAAKREFSATRIDMGRANCAGKNALVIVDANSKVANTF